MRNELKIGILLDKIKPGGPSKIAFEEVRHLQRFGYPARLVLTIEELSEEYRYDDFAGTVPTILLSRNFPALFRVSFKFPYFSFFSVHHVISPLIVPRFLQKDEYNVIVAHETYTCFTAYEVWRWKRIPYIAYIHDPISYILPKDYSRNSPLRRCLPILNSLGKRIDKLIVENSMATITNSKVTSERVKKIARKKEIEVVYPGCFPSPVIPKKRGNYILAFTKWDDTKTPHMFLDLLESVKGEFKLVVAGFWVQETIKRGFIQEVTKRGLGAQVKILGPVNEKRLRELYLNARVLIHPIVEAFGMTALEAAAHGCPFIMPRGSGVTELFTHDIHGFFPEEGNLDEYIKYVDVLLNDERLAWEMGLEAWKTARQHDWNTHARKLEEIVLKHALVCR